MISIINKRFPESRKKMSIQQARVAFGTALVATTALMATGCGSDDGERGNVAAADAAYVLASIVSSGEDSNMYVSLVDSLDGQLGQLKASASDFVVKVAA
jgi:uridine phosphorylase